MIKVFSNNSKIAKKYKFGVEILRNLKHALALDINDGDNKWDEAADKEVNETLDMKHSLLWMIKKTYLPGQ